MASSTLFLASYRPLKTQKNPQLDDVLMRLAPYASTSFELFGPCIPLLLCRRDIPLALGHDLKAQAWIASNYDHLHLKNRRCYLTSPQALPCDVTKLRLGFESLSESDLVFTNNTLVLDFDLASFFGLAPKAKKITSAENVSPNLRLSKVSLDFDIIEYDKAGRQISFYNVHRFHVKNLH